MKKEAINTIKATFEANPKENQFFANEFGHCFKSGGEGLTLVKREELDSLKPEDEDGGTEAGGNEGGGADAGSKKKGKK